MTKKMTTKVLYSTDVDLLQSSLIVTDANTDTHNNCIYLEYNDNDTYQVYRFDLINDLNDWWDLNEIKSFTGFDYGEVAENERDLYFWAHLTEDICSYYGPDNLDHYPQTMTSQELETYLKDYEANS